MIRTPDQDMKIAYLATLGLWLMVIQISGCSTAELKQHIVEAPAKEYYRYIHLNVMLTDAQDTEYVTQQFMKKLDRHGLRAQDDMIQDGTGSALLKIEELDRQTEAVVHRRNLGRALLTMMRGRELRDRPVITIRATLIDTSSGQVVFQADYVTQGPWYADSSEVVGSLADSIIKQLGLHDVQGSTSNGRGRSGQY